MVWIKNHCKCPYKGTQGTFNNPISQGLTGVLEHGRGLTIYRTFGTVQKGANLTIYCILAQLEARKNRNRGMYPEELYIQLDGGSENANQYVLSMIELLVVKRVCRLIYFTRLPTGHTHEDIDACFGTIWGAFRSACCESLELYKKRILHAFGNNSLLKASVVDVMVIPDYRKLLQGMFLTLFSFHLFVFSKEAILLQDALTES